MRSRVLVCSLLLAAASVVPACRPTTVKPTPAPAAPAEAPDWSALVDPFVGTGGHGHTYPGATVPFGMVQLSPDTRTTGWDWCSGYHASDTSIMGFSHTHLSGTGKLDFGDVLLMPTVGAIELSPGPVDNPDAGYRSRFSHDDEAASPGYYAVKLADSGIGVELTATARAGLHRYTFPATQEANVILDLAHGIGDKATETTIDVEGDRVITGLRRSVGWTKDQYLYFVAEFSKPFASFGTSDGGPLAPGQPHAAAAGGTKAVVRFATAAGEAILVKVGISAVDLEGARKNLADEIPAWDFDGVRAAARKQWNETLGRLEIQDDAGAATPKRIFYTSLYHAFLAPTIFSDLDGRYRGSDMKVHAGEGFTYYSTFSLWDTFRAAHPLYTLVVPERVPDMINSLIVQGERHPERQIPIWPIASWESRVMIGQHAIPVIAEAYLKGFRGFDVQRAYALIKENAGRYEEQRALGWFAADKHKESVSQTLEVAYDDWAVAQLAKALGKADDHARFAKAAQAYRNVWDKETGFMRPRLADGSWRTPFDPRALTRAGGGRDYTEGNAFQHSWFVPQDVPGLVDLKGGRAAFAAKLDGLFTESSELSGDKIPDVSGLIGQYAHGNETDHQVPFLYDYVGQPWKTQSRVREILTTMYKMDRDGLSGNEDCGQMSAWYVLAALGLYPVNPVDGNYALAAPLFGRVVLHLPGRRAFTITGKNASAANAFVLGAALDGKPLPRTWVGHQEIVGGGALSFDLGPAAALPPPAARWGTAPDAAPPTTR